MTGDVADGAGVGGFAAVALSSLVADGLDWIGITSKRREEASRQLRFRLSTQRKGGCIFWAVGVPPYPFAASFWQQLIDLRAHVKLWLGIGTASSTPGVLPAPDLGCIAKQLNKELGSRTTFLETAGARMGHSSSSETLPASVKLAAALFVVYGVAVVLNATTVQGAAGWVGAADYPRAFIRLLGTGIIAWGLLQRARWAWWLGLILAVVWLVVGALTVFVFERGDVHWLRPSGVQTFLVISLLCLGLVVALLLSPSARTVFRRPAA